MLFNRNQGKIPRRAAAAIYQRGLAAYEMGRFQEAIDTLTPLASENDLPGTLAAFYLSQAHLRQGLGDMHAARYDAAVTHLTQARRINPSCQNLWQHLTACHVGQGRFDLAAAEMERAHDIGEADDTTPIRVAHALARDNQFDRAVETLIHAIEAQPYRADLRVHLGLLHASVDNYEYARITLEEAVSIEPDNAEARQHLGLAFGALSEPLKAVEHLSHARRLRPADAHLAMMLSFALQAAEQTGCKTTVDEIPLTESPIDNASIRELGEIITQDPEFVEAFIKLPESQMDPSLFATLAQIIAEALEVHPDYADLHFHCSRIQERLGDTKAAIVAAEDAVEINPRYVQALIQLGRLYAKTDRCEEAMERLHAAVENGGDYPDVHFVLGELHKQGGDFKQAGIEYRRALELNANYTRAREALEAVLTA